MKNRHLLITIAWITSASAVLLHGADPQYTVTPLGSLGGNRNGWFSRASGINNNGVIAGQAATASGERHAFLYSNGVMQDLGLDWSPYAINDNSQMAGWSTDASGHRHAILYSGGAMHDLGTFGGTDSAAWGLNNKGQVVGEAMTADNVPHPFLYSDGAMKDLGLFGNSPYNYATSINDKGQILVDSGRPTNETTNHAYLWSGGVVQDLGNLGGPTVSAIAINSSGQIAGDAIPGGGGGSGAFHAYLLSDGVMHDIGVLLGDTSMVLGFNDNGEIVGWTGLAWGNNTPSVAFLYRGGVMVDLNTLIPPDLGWSLASADGINNQGQILAYGMDSVGQQQAFLLSPVKTGVDAVPRISSAKRMTNGDFQMTVSGPVGSQCEVQASSDLKNWVSLSNFTGSDSAAIVIDSLARSFPCRFYRAVIVSPGGN